MDELTVRRLTQRETIALILVSEGKSDKEIARAQNCAQSTVAARMRNIYFKLNARNRTEAVSIAYRQRILNGIAIALFFLSNAVDGDNALRPRTPKSGVVVRIMRKGKEDLV